MTVTVEGVSGLVPLPPQPMAAAIMIIVVRKAATRILRAFTGAASKTSASMPMISTRTRYREPDPGNQILACCDETLRMRLVLPPEFNEAGWKEQLTSDAEHERAICPLNPLIGSRFSWTAEGWSGVTVALGAERFMANSGVAASGVPSILAAAELVTRLFPVRTAVK